MSTRRGVPRASLAYPAAATTVAAIWASTVGGWSLLVGAGVLACGAMTWAALRGPRDGTLLAGQVVPLAWGAAVLTICSAGLDQVSGAQSWRSVLVLAAYPFLGHAVLRLVAAHRRVREADLLVEAALVGTAVGIALHVGLSGSRSPSGVSPWGEAQGAFPAMLVALDAALLVVSVHGIRSRSARRGPLGLIHVGVMALAGAHLWQALELAHGRPGGHYAGALALVGVSSLGAASLHPAGWVEVDRLLEQPPLFSVGHAGVVVTALLAAPAALAVQAVRGLVASAAVTTGAVMSGIILAGYLIGLLRERAMTEHQATHDALTGLPNRTLLVDRLDRSIAHARRTGGSCAALFIDLDRFKEINDTYGHAAGDSLLQAVAARLAGCVRDEDTVARLSGDEFVLLLPHLGSPEQMIIVAQRVIESLSRPLTVAEERILIAGSIGIAAYPNDGTSAEEVLASADAAMYRAKESPGNSWEIFSAELATHAQARLQLEAGLFDGLSRNELVLHYQPVVDATTGLTIGAEALVRWNHPERGFLLPGHFVPVAEQSDLIVMLGDWVIHEACRELRHWQDLGLLGATISVNVSARQFRAGLVSTVAAALRVTGANPKNLVVELTESTIVDNVDAVAVALEELRAMGVRSAIDDFGTGYCGLRYLSALPVTSLKIDRSFINGMTASGAAIVSATIAMGHSLGLTVVAEGIETPEQQRFLSAQGCDRLQGFLLGHPVPAEDLVDRLRAERLVSTLSTRGPQPDPASRRSIVAIAG